MGRSGSDRGRLGQRPLNWENASWPRRVAALTVAVEKLLDAGLFLDDFVGRLRALYELILWRDLVEDVLWRRAFNVR